MLHEAPGIGAQFPAQAVIGHELPDPACQPLQVVRFIEQSGLAVPENLRRAAMVGRDDGAAVGHPFHDNEAEGFGDDRGDHEDIDGLIDRADVGDEADLGGAPPDAEPVDEPVEFGLIELRPRIGVTDEEELDPFRQIMPEGSEGPGQEPLPLPAVDPPDTADDQVVGREAVASPEPVIEGELAVDDLGGESVVDAPEFVRVSRSHLTYDRLGDTDDGGGERHDQQAEKG